MKASEIRKMTPEQLNEKLAGLKKDLFYLRMQHVPIKTKVIARTEEAGE